MRHVDDVAQVYKLPWGAPRYRQPRDLKFHHWRRHYPIQSCADFHFLLQRYRQRDGRH